MGSFPISHEGWSEVASGAVQPIFGEIGGCKLPIERTRPSTLPLPLKIGGKRWCSCDAWDSMLISKSMPIGLSFFGSQIEFRQKSVASCSFHFRAEIPARTGSFFLSPSTLYSIHLYTYSKRQANGYGHKSLSNYLGAKTNQRGVGRQSSFELWSCPAVPSHPFTFSSV